MRPKRRAGTANKTSDQQPDEQGSDVDQASSLLDASKSTQNGLGEGGSEAVASNSTEGGDGGDEDEGAGEDDHESDDDGGAKGKGKGKGKGKAKSKAKTTKAAPKKSKEKKEKPKKPDGTFQDIPDAAYWTARPGVCYLLSLPVEIIDLILASPLLTLPDFLALAGVSRAFRACFYTAPPNTKSLLWESLCILRPMWILGESYDDDLDHVHPEKAALVRHIWSGKVNVASMQVIRDAVGKAGGSKDVAQEKEAIRSAEWDSAIYEVNATTIHKSNSKKVYKVSDSQLDTIPHMLEENPHHPKFSQMKVFREASVQSLAYAWHGGYFGHLDWLDKKRSIAEKAAATREKNAPKAKKTHAASKYVERMAILKARGMQESEILFSHLTEGWSDDEK